jgi:hypothetical protein
VSKEGIEPNVSQQVCMAISTECVHVLVNA